jgi:hypothetical protein
VRVGPEIAIEGVTAAADRRRPPAARAGATQIATFARRTESMLIEPIAGIFGGFIIGLCLERIVRLLRQPTNTTNLK